MNTIDTDHAEANVLSNVRQDWRNLHSHPWVDASLERKRNLRGYIRNALSRVRTYRAEKAERSARKGAQPEASVCQTCFDGLWLYDGQPLRGAGPNGGYMTRKPCACNPTREERWQRRLRREGQTEVAA